MLETFDLEIKEPMAMLREFYLSRSSTEKATTWIGELTPRRLFLHRENLLSLVFRS